MIMVKCSFCGDNVPEGKGKVFVKNDGRVFNFCGSKCQKNFRMKRAGKSVRWTKTAQSLKEKSK
jgi:large subunit ribosomal protein L24e